MNGRPELAEAIALALVEHGTCSGTRLAAVVAVRKTTVLRELRDARRFERVGRGANSAWRLAGTDWEPIQRLARPDPDSDLTFDLRDLLTAIESRLGAIERRLALVEPPLPTIEASLAGQITIDEAIATATNGETPAP